MVFRREGENPHAAQLFQLFYDSLENDDIHLSPLSGYFFHGPGMGVLALNLDSFPAKRANPGYFHQLGA
jgi:hypothetical protein